MLNFAAMAVTPKYRILTHDELQEMEKEFIDFLVVNGITADQWVKIKDEDKSTAEDMITLFSDVVLEGVLRKIQFLEYRSKTDIKTFQCLAEKIVLVGMTGKNGVDFENEAFIKSALNSPPEGIQIYTTDKPYKLNRQKELFQMLESGCEISDGKLFKALSLALV